jgi:hypothetical protein
MRLNYVQPLPTPSSAYQAIAELNRGFEQDKHNLNALHRFNFFPEEDLNAWGTCSPDCKRTPVCGCCKSFTTAS